MLKKKEVENSIKNNKPINVIVNEEYQDINITKWKKKILKPHKQIPKNTETILDFLIKNKEVNIQLTEPKRERLYHTKKSKLGCQ